MVVIWKIMVAMQETSTIKMMEVELDRSRVLLEDDGI